ncbi:MAG TPA: hypothetical protein VNY29_06900 [Terriglobales bacterium]|jgi:hypothetical protein|nr:hypothetical protein [Terriglobales bacterium]
MDSYHRHLHHSDARIGRDCQFCARFDPDFSKRHPVDRWVHDKPEDSAMSHLSENGHIRHRIFEIAVKRAQGMAASRDFVGKSA